MWGVQGLQASTVSKALFPLAACLAHQETDSRRASSAPLGLGLKSADRLRGILNVVELCLLVHDSGTHPPETQTLNLEKKSWPPCAHVFQNTEKLNTILGTYKSRQNSEARGLSKSVLIGL